ncbi:hypothetical protein ACTFIR_011300 [Dictyostelium discoideum]
MKDSHPNFGKETSSTEDYKDIEFVQWLVFFLFVALIPSTIWLWKKFNPKPIAKHFDCSCEGCERKSEERIKLEKKEMKSTSNKIKIGIIAFFWVLFFFLLYIVLTSTAPTKEPYNPYTILGIEPGVTTEEIKKAHKKMSLKFHPDKNPGNVEAEEMYMAIAKAYQALTDDAIREKWETYGNPDGPQRMSIGIALPSWLINKGNSPIVLAVYLLLLVVALPSAVYYWNKSTKSKLPAQIEQQSLALYYHVIDGTTRLKSMIEILAATTEYKTSLVERKSDDENLKNLFKSIPDAYKVKKARFNAPYIVKGTILLYAHLCRIKDMPQTLRDDLNQIIKTYRHYLTGAFQVTREKRQLAGLVELVKLSQCIMQSAWEDQSLKQLPHLDSFMAQQLKSNHVQDIAKFKAMSEEKRKELLTKVGGTALNDAKIKDIENILEKIPCQVGIKWRITSENPTFLASSVCILEVEFVDQIALKKQKQEEAAAAIATKEAAKNKPNLAPAEKKGGARKRTTVKKTKDGAKEDESSPSSSGKAEEKDQSEDEQEEEIKEEKKEKKEKKKILDADGNEIEDSDDDSEFDDDEYSDSDDDDAWEKVPKKSLINPPKELCHSPFTFDDKPVNFWILMGNRQKNELVALGKTETFTPGTIVKYPFLSAAEIGTAHYSLYVMCDGYLGCDVETDVSINLAHNPRPLQLQPLPRVQQQPLPPQRKIGDAADDDSDDDEIANKKSNDVAQQKQQQQAAQQKQQAAQQAAQQQQQQIPEIITPSQQQPTSPQQQLTKPLTQKQINQQQKLLKKQQKAAATATSSPSPVKEVKKDK